jgi:2-polyprenyl-6-methoxyphenol 4-hydroxylase
MSETGSTDYDIIIAGGGMVGASLAISLAAAQDNPLNILVVEGVALPADTGENPQYQPSFDARCTALSFGSHKHFDRIGVWQDLREHTQPIRQIQVSDRGRFGSVLMDCEEEGLEALGYVVENHWLGKVLLHRLSSLDQVTLQCPASVTTCQPARDKVYVTVKDGESADSQHTLSAKLLVIADGANSALCRQLGIGSMQQEYGQTAIISTVAHRRPHDGKAFERFTERGSVAFLPLVAGSNKEHRSALVWVNDSDSAEELCAIPENQFLARLQEQFGYRLGRLDKVGQRFAYPLKRIQAQEQYRSSVAVLGNAAHSVHPVAGQGFNLSLRDVARLAESLLEAYRAARSIGDPALLQRYYQQQESDQDRTIAASGLLPGLFHNRRPALKLASDAGLLLMDLMPGIKSGLVRYATGLGEKDFRLNG